MAAPSAPRLIVTDALGRRIVPLDKPLFTIGRRSETDLRLTGADISRVHAEITLDDGVCTIRDHASRFGTFVNGERITERVLAGGDQIRLGQSGDAEITFVLDDEAPSVEKSAVSAATEQARWRRRSKAARAGRAALDEVLPLVLTRRSTTGAERGHHARQSRQGA